MLVDYSDSESEGKPARRAVKRKRESDDNNDDNNDGGGSGNSNSQNRNDYDYIGRKNNRSDHNQHGSTRSILPLPPLPPSFHALYATNVRGAVSDDPSLHGGRARKVAHVEGNWPTHIFLEWIPTVEELRKLEHVLHRARRCCIGQANEAVAVRSLLRSDLNVPLPLHISLSAPLTLKTEQKDVVAAAVEVAVRSSNGSSGTFSVSPTRLCWVANSERSRSFLVLKLTRPERDDLNRLLKACNSTVASFGLQTLYSGDDWDEDRNDNHGLSEDAFHISIAWALGDVGNLPVPEITSRKGSDKTDHQRERPQIPKDVSNCHDRGHDVSNEVENDADYDDDDEGGDISSLKISFHTVKLKVGNIIKDILL